MATHQANRAPKQWCLSKHETVNSFENWRQNLLYTLSLDANFAPFLVDGFTWGKKTKAQPLRGLTDDGNEVAAASRKNAQQKVTQLELMLGQVANYCPIISRSTLVKNSTSMMFIWNAIRMHFGFQSTGGHFIDFADLKLEPQERPEDLYQRLMAFVEDNLLVSNGNISHHGEAVTEDEELSPTLENLVVLLWLQLIHPDLPKLVKQRYGTELRSRTLATIKPEISQALDSLLEEIKSIQDARVMRSGVTYGTSRPRQPNRFKEPTRTKSSKICPLCKQAGRRSDHFLSKCSYLPEGDKKYMTKARLVAAVEEEIQSSDSEGLPDDMCDSLRQPSVSCQSAIVPVSIPTSTSRVQVVPAPYIDMFYKHFPVRVTVDSASESNMMKESLAKRIAVPIKPSTQSAYQADGITPLNVKGEASLDLVRDGHSLVFETLIIEKMDVDILGGTPFMTVNDVFPRPALLEVVVLGEFKFPYGPGTKVSSHHTVRRTQPYLVRSPEVSTVVWPGDYIEVAIPSELAQEQPLALEPRMDNKPLSVDQPDVWPQPEIVNSVGGKIRIMNSTSEPKKLRRNEHFCQVQPVVDPDSISDLCPDVQPESAETPPAQVRHTGTAHESFTESIKLDPDGILPPAVVREFQDTHREFATVFNPKFGGYNGHSGPFEAVVNMGPVLPPQHKGRIPQYSKDKLVELQNKFDSLGELEVFARPEDIGVVVEYLNPSFLIKKPHGGFRLVTAFTEVAGYCKPQPSLMTDVDSTLRSIAQWKYIICTDVTSAFYQIPLSQDSMKFCGVATPFRGVRVYTRCAMGMPGSETALEELMCRIIGHLIQEGVAAKIADDLFCGGNTPEELLTNWRKILVAMHANGMALSGPKTIIAPRSTTILGWIWSQGTLQASPHRIATLATCSPPERVQGLRSFIGAFKVLARVVPHAASLLGPLDDAAAGKQSRDKVAWSYELKGTFCKCQNILTESKTIVLPRPDDQLWIVTDGAVRDHGLGATLYVSRDGKIRLAGFFSAKLRKRQVTWIPCEIEALSIASAIKHFSPYIVQSKHETCVLTDSKPCVQAFGKLSRGEFSNSIRVSTFLATASRYLLSIQHLSGKANLPSDFASRNAPNCIVPHCQVCTFVRESEECVVRAVTSEDVMSNMAKLPFTSRPAWASNQSECHDLRRTRAHLKQGTRPSKKATNVKDVKRYLNVVSISQDGVLVVKHEEPFAPVRERIVVPRQVLAGLVTALHIKLSHPTCYQMKRVLHRYFYALDMDKTVEQVSKSCHPCAALQKAPHTLIEQSTSDPTESVGAIFAADVIKRERQLIFLLREYVTSYTMMCIINNEKSSSLQEAIIKLCVDLRPLDGPPAVVRTDPAPGFQSLVDDKFLSSNRINIEIGRVKNQNKNPVADKAIQELEEELLKLCPEGGPVSPLMLALATSNLNSRLRNSGLPAREMLLQRDQFTNCQIPVADRKLILDQHETRLKNHPYSEKSKAPRGQYSIPQDITVGDLVYIHSDKNKSKARDRYLVVAIEGDWCNVRKFTGSQLRNTSYRVKLSECYKVPTDVHINSHHQYSNESDEEQDICEPIIEPPVPHVLSRPAESLILHHSDQDESDMGLNMSECPSVLNESQIHSMAGDESTTVNLDNGFRRSTREKKPPKYLQEYVLD